MQNYRLHLHLRPLQPAGLLHGQEPLRHADLLAGPIRLRPQRQRHHERWGGKLLVRRGFRALRRILSAAGVGSLAAVPLPIRHLHRFRQNKLPETGRRLALCRLRHRPAARCANPLPRSRHSLKALFHPLVRDRHRERGHKKTALPVLRHGIIRYLCGHING